MSGDKTRIAELEAESPREFKQRWRAAKAEARAERAEAGAKECARHLVETGRALERAEARCAEMRKALEEIENIADAGLDGTGPDDFDVGLPACFLIAHTALAAKEPDDD